MQRYYPIQPGGEIMRDYMEYLREQRLPHIWCPGCGNGIVTGAIARAIARAGLDENKTVIVSGIGCSSRASGYMNFDTLHTAHGRALAFATGVKLGRPELNVIVITGDGDCTAIGGNHFIHAARRNLDLTVILFNNNIYGMTGGQYSPLTPTGHRATTAPFGTIERPFDACKMAETSGATFVARGTAFHAVQLTDLVLEGLTNKGFSFIEAITQCPISYGRQNKLGNPAEMLANMRDSALPAVAFSKLNAEQRQNKFPTGALHRSYAPEYSAEYAKIIAQAQEVGS
jgi:2-oxoglutarate/2-oxoacid ferredoxin oxidoreductase subunit beta